MATKHGIGLKPLKKLFFFFYSLLLPVQAFVGQLRGHRSVALAPCSVKTNPRANDSETPLLTQT